MKEIFQDWKVYILFVGYFKCALMRELKAIGEILMRMMRIHFDKADKGFHKIYYIVT